MLKSSSNNQTRTIIKKAVIDGNGGRHYLIGGVKADVWIDLSDFFDDEKAAFKKIAKTGIAAVTSSSRNLIRAAIEGHTDFEEGLVAAQPGWQTGFVYVHPNGEAQQPENSTVEPIVAFEPDSRWSRKGKFVTWKGGLSKTIGGNNEATGLLCYGFLPILLDCAPNSVLNPSIELIGPLLCGKSTFARMITSIYGGDPKNELGLGQSWDFTKHAYETIRRRANDALLFLDEGNIQDQNLKDNCDFLFRQSISGGRVRPDETEIKQRVRSALISTGNESLLSRAGASLNVTEAAASRLITLEFDGSIMRTVPAGFKDHEDAMEYLNDHITNNFGTASRKFVAKVIKHRSVDDAKFKKRINTLMKRFRKAVSDDKTISSRGMNVFALTYAAGYLAKEWRILPAECSDPMLAAQSLLQLATKNEAKQGPSASLGKITKMIRENSGAIRKVTRKTKPKPKEPDSQVFGYVFIGEGSSHEFFLDPVQVRRELGPSNNAILRELKAQGYLKGEGKSSANLKLSSKPPAYVGFKHRVFKFTLDYESS